MKINRQPSDITISFSPKDYWLRKNEHEPDWLGEYCLTVRIDMSYKGKEDQEGCTVMYLDEKQAQQFRDSGFSEIL